MSLRRPIGGKVVVITGAARGIGAELAVTLAARGARLALLGLEPEALAETARRCGPNAATWHVDVTDGDRLAQVAEEVVARFARVDVVVANAGIAAGGPLRLADPAAFDRVIEVNLLGSVRTARAFLPHLIASGGLFHQVASAAALAPVPMMAAYCASKAGVEAFAHALRAEVAHHGVSVGVSYFSWTDTDMVRGSDEVRELREHRRRLPGLVGRTNELAPAVERLADGIERRAPHVYGQAFVRALPPLRGLLPGIVYRVARRDVARAERELAAQGPQVTLPVGPGGRADTENRTARTGGRATA